MLKLCQNSLSPLLSSAGRGSGTITSQCCIHKKVLEKLGLPPPPKRPLNPYALFAKDQLPKLKEQRPESKQSELMSIVSQKWKTVDESQKSALQARAASERAVYEKAKAAFQDMIKPHEVDILKAEKQELLKQSRKDLQKLGKPKRPASAFALYVSSQKSLRGDLSVSEFMKIIAKQWQELPENKKQEYQDIYLKDVSVYEKKLKDWENKMIAQGFHELVPSQSEKVSKKKSSKKDSKKEDAAGKI